MLSNKWENILDKSREETKGRRRKTAERESKGSRGEHRVIEQEQEHMEYSHCRKLATSHKA